MNSIKGSGFSKYNNGIKLPDQHKHVRQFLFIMHIRSKKELCKTKLFTIKTTEKTPYICSTAFAITK